MPKSSKQADNSSQNQQKQGLQSKKHKKIQKKTDKKKEKLSEQKEVTQNHPVNAQEQQQIKELQSQHKSEHDPKVNQEQQLGSQQQSESSQQSQSEQQQQKLNSKQILQKYQKCDFKQFFQTLSLKIPKNFQINPQSQPLTLTKKQLQRIQQNIQTLKLQLLNRQIFKIQNIQYDNVKQMRKALNQIGKIVSIQEYGQWSGNAVLHVCMETGRSLGEITGILHNLYDVDWWIKAVPL